MSVSVLIPTKNEASNLPRCLESVAWSNDVVVVDSASADGSADIVARYGARLERFVWNGAYPKKKNWALDNIDWRNEWVLILDADEVLTPALSAEIRLAVLSDVADGFYINRRFMFLGSWIRHCGYYPSWNLRLFKHSLGRYERMIDGDTSSGDNEVHEHIVISGKTSYLKHDMLHFAYPDLSAWVEKHNRYSNWEAHVEVDGTRRESDAPSPGGSRRRLRELSRRMPFRPTLRFLYSYVLKAGFLDGRPGYMMCRLLATYEMLSVFKARELRLKRAMERSGPNA